MIKVVLLAALVVCALASPRQLRGAENAQEQNPSGLAIRLLPGNSGGYYYAYQLNDGRIREERATLQNAGTPQEYLRIEGRRQSCSRGSQCQSADMQETRYTIDENGYSEEIVPVDQRLSALTLASLLG